MNTNNYDPNMSRRGFLDLGARSLGGIAIATAVPSFLTGCGKGKNEKLNLKYDSDGRDGFSRPVKAVSVPVNTIKIPVNFGNYEAEIPGGNVDGVVYGFVRRGNELFAMEDPTQNIDFYDERQAVLRGQAVLLGNLIRYRADPSQVQIKGRKFGVLQPVEYIQEKLPVDVLQGGITIEGVEFAEHQGYLFFKTLIQKDEKEEFGGLYALRRPVTEASVIGPDLIIQGNGILVRGSKSGKQPKTEPLELLIPIIEKEVEAPVETKPAEAPKEESQPKILIEPIEDPTN